MSLIRNPGLIRRGIEDIPPGDPPAAPTGLTAAQIGTTASVSLNWTDNATDETSYRVERKTEPGGNWGTLINLPANSVSHTDNSVAYGTTYTYRVFARRGSFDSLPSNTATASVVAASDPDADAYIAALNAAGGPQTTAQEAAIQDFVVGMKADLIWTLYHQIFLLYWDNGNQCQIDLCGNQNLSFLGNWSFAPNQGYCTPDGSTAYIDPNQTPAQQGMSTSGGAVVAYTHSTIEALQALFGASDAGPTNRIQLLPDTGITTILWMMMNDFEGFSSTIDTKAGLWMISRQDTDNSRADFEDSAGRKNVATRAIAATALTNNPIYAGAHNNDGTASDHWSSPMSLIAYGAGHTEAQKDLAMTRFYTLLNALGDLTLP